LYFSAQSKKKRNLAYSRVQKCLLGGPLAPGEPPMPRFRSAWRGKLLEPAKPGEKEDSEESKAKAWPNRCVADMVAFTDTLKALGEMKEGEKDLGFYSRNLSKETAGDNWKNIDTYKTALEEFMTAASDAKFELADVPDVTAPKLAEAKGMEDLESGGALGAVSAEIDREASSLGAVRFYVPAGKGLPEKLCESKKGDELKCVRPVPGGLPSEASGVPWILGADDDAPYLLAFGRRGGISDGSSISTGVFRSGDGLQIIPSDKFYVAGGWSRAAGPALLLKPDDDPGGEKFKIATLDGSGKVVMGEVKLDDWNGQPSSIAVVGADVVWVTHTDEVRRRSLETPTAAPIVMGKLPGSGSRVRACKMGDDYAVIISTSADGLSRMAVTFIPKGEWKGSMQVVDEGWTVSCGKSKLTILSGVSFASCGLDGCETKPIEVDRLARRAVLDGTVVDVLTDAGLLRVRWTRDGMEMASALYDGHLKGRDVLVKSRLGAVRMSVGRDFALLAVSADEKIHFVRLDASPQGDRGGVTAVKVSE
jgi:hypothetical protein